MILVRNSMVFYVDVPWSGVKVYIEEGEQKRQRMVAYGRFREY